MIYSARLRKIDWPLITTLLVLSSISLVTLASLNQIFFQRQIVWLAASFLVIFSGAFLNWRWLVSQTWFRRIFYWLSVLLLFLVNLQLHTVRGTKSWFVFSGFQFEPSELAKVALILVLAGFFSRRYVAAWRNKNIFISFFYVLLPVALVIIQPDFGSALVLFGIWLGFLFSSGINKKKAAIGLVIVLAILILLWMFYFKPYQKERIIGFLMPNYDPLGINYNTIQSKIAIGSAGLLGKGFKMGSQSQLGFLPEGQGDFIFAAFAEEWGLFGVLGLIAAFIVLIYRLMGIGLKASDNYSKFVVLGTIVVLAVQFFLNLGSNLGLVPVVGLTLPFVSYGGSSLLTLALLLSIIQSIKLESR